MKKFDYLIIGGGIAGTTAAETIRSRDIDSSIAIISREPHRLYSRTLLSKPAMYRGDYDAKMIFIKAEEWYAKHDIALLTGTAATAHDPHKRNVLLEDGTRIEYGKLLLALGSVPHTYRPPGFRLDSILQLQTIDDALALKKSVKTGTNIVIVGKSFVAFEASWIAHQLGAKVHLVNRFPHVFYPTIIREQAQTIEAAMRASGIRIHSGTEIQDAQEGFVTLTDGEEVPSDVILAGVGVVTPSGWLHGVDRTSDGAVLIDRKFKTNVVDVFAAGDGAAFRDTGERAGNWEASMAMGRTAGMYMVSSVEKTVTPYEITPVSIVRGFGQDIAFVGDLKWGGDIKARFEEIDAKSSTLKFLLDEKPLGGVILNRPQYVHEFRVQVQEAANVA